ncbi:MAG: TonB-dependent receptor [Edaphobacter sp.]
MQRRKGTPDHIFTKANSGTFLLPGFTLAMVMLMLTFFLSPTLSAQVANSVITGRVTDSSGGVLTNAGVTLTQTGTGLVLHTVTNGEGTYSFPSLQTGLFLVEIARPGFKAAKATITLEVGQTAQIDLALTIGSESESVTIEADSSAQLDTQDSNLAYTVGAHQVADLPLNGRNPYGLAALAPGIMAGTSFGAGVSTARGAVVAAATNNFQSNGGIGGSNEILLDGVSIVVCCQGQPPLTPSVEVVDQFKVLTSAPPAQFGRSSGGILNIVTKTGANALHGDLYEFFRNDQLDAAPYFTKRTGAYPIPTRHDYRLPHRFNQYGGFVSGPVRIPMLYNGRDKTFFTFGYEGTRNANSSFITATVPTVLMRQGVFTEAPALVYDPYNVTAAGAGYVRQPLAAGCDATTCYGPGRYVPTINPVAAKLLPLLPLPNASGINNNYSYSQALTDTENQFNFRVDHNFSPSQRTFVRGTRDVNNHHQNDLFNQPNGPNGINQALVAYLFGIGHTWTVSPTFLLQFNYGFGYQQNHQIPQNFTGFNAGDYGFANNFLTEQQNPGLPVVSFNGLQQLGNATNANYFVHYTHILDIAATLQRGNHNITAGYDGRYIIENEQSVGNPLGSFSFDATMSNGPNPSGTVPTGQSPFDSFAAFLLGATTTTSLQRQATIAFTQPYNAFFLQDDWRLRPNLTVNLGVRYDIEMGFRERYNRWADFNPTAINPLSASTGLAFQGGAQYLGAAGNPGRTWQTSYKEVAPRVGFSYSANPTTVVRGGFGILFLPTSERGYGSGTLGFSQSTSTTNTLNGTPSNTFSDPFPNGVALPAGPAAGIQAGTGTGASGFLYNTPVSYQEQWNFGIEQQLKSNLIFNINYAGSHGVKLPITGHPNDLNPKYFGQPGDLGQVSYLQAKVANPFYGSVTTGSLAAPTVQRIQLLSAFPQYISNTAMSNGSVGYLFQGIGSASFNAMQVGLSYRKASGLNGSVFYTWSKLLGNVSDLTNGFLNTNGNPGVQNYYLLKQYERSNLATDIPHRIVGNFIYPLPFGRGQRFGNGIPGWANLILGGWKLNGIAFVQSGNPLSLTQSGGQPFSGGRPTYVPGINPLTSGSSHERLGGAGQSQAYLNPAAFRLSRAFELGNVPRSAALMRAPLSFQDDLSAIKDFKIHEAINLQFRMEAFNVLNRVQFGFPNTTVGSSTFGYITSQTNLPRNVQLALKLNF